MLEKCLRPVFLCNAMKMPVMRKPSENLFAKIILCKGYGFHTPQDGSVCKIKIISDETNELPTLTNCTREIIVGDVDDPIECLIEDCIRTMKEEEDCFMIFKSLHVNTAITPMSSSDVPKEGNDTVIDDSCKVDYKLEDEVVSSISEKPNLLLDPENDEQSGTISPEPVKEDNDAGGMNECVQSDLDSTNEMKLQLQLLSYTREPEIWEMSITEKWRRASYHKQRGLELYARGIYQYAFRRFGLTLKYVISLEHDVPSGQEEGMDIKGLKLSCYLNVAACQMRHHNFESVVINSSKALLLQPDNAKALYRRGAAYLQLQEYEKAKDDLTAAQILEPKNQAILKQLQMLKIHVQKLNQYYASAMKTMFS